MTSWLEAALHDPDREPSDLEGVPGWRRLQDGAPHPKDLEDIVRAVLGVSRPERILLFGSGARGEMDDKSDIDILVIADAPNGVRLLRKDINKALPMGLRWTDVLVLTPSGLRKRLEDWEDETLAGVLDEAKTLYQRSGRWREPTRTSATTNMNAEGRILAASRRIQDANGTLASAAAATDLGYEKSKWQRIVEANRAVECAIKGVAMALDGRVRQRCNSRELALHLHHRGEDVGVGELDELEVQRGRTPTAYDEFENPELTDISDEETQRALEAATTIVGKCQRRVRKAALRHRIHVSFGTPGGTWTAPPTVRQALARRARQQEGAGHAPGSTGSKGRRESPPVRPDPIRTGETDQDRDEEVR